MTFTQLEIDYLTSQRLGRLATIQPNGTLQNSPVGYRYDPTTDTIDVVGYNLTTSQKFRNIRHNEKVAFVVDDIPSRQPLRIRCLEIRGVAEAIDPASDPSATVDVPTIRIHPRRVISFGLDNLDVEPHRMVASKRNVT